MRLRNERSCKKATGEIAGAGCGMGLLKKRKFTGKTKDLNGKKCA